MQAYRLLLLVQLSLITISRYWNKEASGVYGYIAALTMLTTLLLWRGLEDPFYLFDAHYCHMGTAIKHPVPDRVKPPVCNF